MLSAAGRPNIVVGSPPEFKGEPDIWAPEELLVGSLNTCMMLTFLTLAQAQGLTPVGYESEAEGLLENVEGKYHITEVTVRPRVILKTEAELESARKSMESVEAHCFIANSINARVKLTPEFVVAPHQSKNVSKRTFNRLENNLSRIRRTMRRQRCASAMERDGANGDRCGGRGAGRLAPPFRCHPPACRAGAKAKK